MVLLAVAFGGCRPDALRDVAPFAAELGELVSQLRAPLRYDDPEHAERFSPTGLLLEAGDPPTLWVWSFEHPVQVGLRRDLRGAYEPALKRRGALGTRRCVTGGGALPGMICVGQHEPRGLVAFGGDFDSGLPHRRGFRDVAADPQRGVVWVLDPLERAVWTLDATGSVIGQAPAPESATRMGPLGEHHLWVLAGTEPRLSLLPIDGAGLLGGGAIGIPLEAPQRDAVWDPARQLLWTVGPEDRRVRRAEGPIEGAGSALVGRSLHAMLHGDSRPLHLLELAPLGLVDATAVALSGDALVVAATGSDRVLLTAPGAPGAAWRVAVLDGGLAPWAVATIGEGIAVASKLDDRVRVGSPSALAAASARCLSRSDPRQTAQRHDLKDECEVWTDTVVLDDRPRESPVDLGERLFYGALLWQRRPASDVTCNTCHWEGGTDHRLQPGFREERWEMTRPLDGISAVTPIFSTGFAAGLPDAVEGLVRTLDPRLWDRADHGPWWLESRRLRTKGGVRELSAQEVREALLAWLLARPVTPPPLRAPGEALSTEALRGLEVFERDCASCHRPAPSTDAPPVEAPAEWLVTRPLVHGAALFAKTGQRPLFAPDGTRVSPLLDPTRGGPYFTNGGAKTLMDVLRGFRGDAAEPHGAGRQGRRLTAEERVALLRFLGEI